MHALELPALVRFLPAMRRRSPSSPPVTNATARPGAGMHAAGITLPVMTLPGEGHRPRSSRSKGEPA
jgi:hypothetical protein